LQAEKGRGVFKLQLFFIKKERRGNVEGVKDLERKGLGFEMKVGEMEKMKLLINPVIDQQSWKLRNLKK